LLQQYGEQHKLCQCKYNLAEILGWEIQTPEIPGYLLETLPLQILPMQLQHHMVHKLFQHSKIVKEKNNSLSVVLEQLHHEAEHKAEELDSKANFHRVVATSF
jgi:hypothetical protein